MDSRVTSMRLTRLSFLRSTGLAAALVLLNSCAGSPPASPTAAPTTAPTSASSTMPQAAPTPVATSTIAPTPTNAPAQPTPTIAATTAPQANITMTFWTPGGSKLWCPSMWENIMHAYEKATPGVHFEQVQCGTGQQDFQQVLLARIAAGNPPDSTVIWNSPVALGVRGALVVLDDFMKTAQYAGADNWPQAVLASCQFRGRTYGLPVTAGSYAIWYNGDWLQKYGISSRDKFPKTWDDLRALSKQITQWKGDKLDTAGFLPWRDQYTLPIWSALNGSQIYDAQNSKYTIDDASNVALMDYAVTWLNDEYKGDITKVDNSGVSWGGYPGDKEQPPAFQIGRLASFVEGSWLMGDLYASVQPKFANWDVALFPVGPNGKKSVSGYWPNWLVIPKGSKQHDAAFKWLDYISGEGVKTWYATVPDLPANKKFSRDTAPDIVVNKRGREFAVDAAKFFFDQLDNSTPMWDSPVQDFGTDQLKRAIDRIMHKLAKPKDALAEAQKASQQELEKVLKTAAQ